MELSKVIIKPLTTEKSVELNKLGQHVFMVNSDANKVEVMQAVSKFYGTKVLSCRIAKMPAKSNSKRLKRRAYSKAIVTLPKDSKFDSSKLKG